MPFSNIFAKDIQGLLLALDARQVEKPLIINGKNFLFDAEGPFSGFGTTLSSFINITDPEYFFTFKVLDKNNVTIVLYFTETVVYQHDLTSMVFRPLFTYVNDGKIGPWSASKVGIKYYFCHRAVGVIIFNTDTNNWELHASSDLPPNPQSVTESGGRLVILGDDRAAWSAQEDGEDLNPTPSTGAGFQLTSIVGGDPLLVAKIENGFLSYTTSGIMASVFVGAAGTPFRHYPLSSEFRLFNRFSHAIDENGAHIFLDDKGIYTTSGQNPVDFDPLFSEFFRNKLVDTLPITDYVIRFFYDTERVRFYFAISFSEVTPIYTLCYVKAVQVQKWGRLDTLFYAIGYMYISMGTPNQIIYGYISIDGLLCSFTKTPYIEILPISNNIISHFYRVVVQYPIVIDTDVHNMSSVVKLVAVDESALVTQDRASGWYKDVDLLGTLTSSVIIRNLTGLDSEIEVGLFRYIEQRFPDEMGEVLNVSIGAGFTPVGQEEEDWNIDTGEEDWNVIPGEEDWGLEIANTEIFNALIAPTNDGSNTLLDVQGASLEQTLTLISSAGAQNYYDCHVVGVYHIITLNALVSNETFHLKSLEISGNLAGRI